MPTKSLSQKIRTGIKPFADRLGIGGWLRQAYVETLMLGERAKFTWTGYPSTSSTILLAGSGRSGTTWLADALCTLPGVQQIFEPLHPRYNPDIHRITNRVLDENGHSRSQTAVYLRPETEIPEWTLLIERALTGRTRNYFTDSARTSFFPERFLVKDIWANLMLGYIAKYCNPKIIYILRHPCAVIHSRLSVDWAANVDGILDQPNLVSDYLKNFEDEILNERNAIGAHAVWWAVENYVALQQLRNIPHFPVYYEDLVLQPYEVLENLLLWLGYEQMPIKAESLLLKPGRMSGKILNYRNKDDRLTRWQRNLSQEDQKRILSWSRRFGLTIYDETPLPAYY